MYDGSHVMNLFFFFREGDRYVLSFFRNAVPVQKSHQGVHFWNTSKQPKNKQPNKQTNNQVIGKKTLNVEVEFT